MIQAIYCKIRLFALLLPVFIFVSGSGSSFADEIINGFEEDASESSDYDTEKTDSEVPEIFEHGLTPSPFSLDGHFKLGASCNFAHEKPEEGETDWRGLSRLRSDLLLELNAKFSDSWQARIIGKGFYDFAYAIKGRNQFTDEVLDNYEKELELGETYVLGSLTDSLDIKAGRQIVVWGKSDNIRVTDVLNPLDMREPGLTDIEDLRLPVAMTRLDYYIGDWSLTGIAIHEIRFNKNPVYGSDFYPALDPPPDEDKPGHCGKNTEYAVAVNAILSGWDIAFYLADFYNDMPHRDPGPLLLKHARLNMFGAAFNAAVGNWLLKTEAAYIDGFEFSNAPGKDYSRIDVLAGIEYSGFKDTAVSIEAVNRHINDFDESLELSPDEARENEFQWVARLTRNFLHETLTLTFLASAWGETGQYAAFQRFCAEYDATDAVKITGGVVLYQSEDITKYGNIGDNDRLFIEFKYSF
ncbi:MAG: DUF1302 family protein [Desulfobacterales bacterium]|nr:DUF1302 family protein [Desulfobacterales bacterium]